MATHTATPLGNAIQFLQDFGFFTVVLPFLLVFTIIFGILEKTKIFGVEKDKQPKKNLNSMIAFVIAFFVVAASNIVEVIQASLPWVSLVLIIIISFLLLTGVFFGDEEYKLWDKQKGVFVMGRLPPLISKADKLEAIADDGFKANWFVKFLDGKAPVVCGFCGAEERKKKFKQ